MSSDKLRMHWNDDDQYLFAASPLQPHMASFPADNSESDLAENLKHFSARDEGSLLKAAQL